MDKFENKKSKDVKEQGSISFENRIIDNEIGRPVNFNDFKIKFQEKGINPFEEG